MNTTLRIFSPRPSIHCVDDARLVEHEHHPHGQGILRLVAPAIAQQARPGTFVHIRCHPLLPMRRPMSIMGTNGETLEILYKVTGAGTRLLSMLSPGMSLSLLGPIGQPFHPQPERPYKVLVGGGVGLPPVLFLAESLVKSGHDPQRILLLYGSEEPFPFELSSRTIAGASVTTLERTERLAIPTRLASRKMRLAGIHSGLVTELLASHLRRCSAHERDQVEVAACGPTAMLREVQRILDEYGIPGQLCLEEWMACAVGGCAGCAVLIRGPEGQTMKRVCVDGPVFPSDAVIFT